MKRLVVSRWAVLFAMLLGVMSPTLSMSASAAVADGPTQAQASLAYVDALLARSTDDDDKKLPDDEEEVTPEDEETPEDEPTDEDEPSSDGLIGVLGGSRADFEDEFGEPVDDADADDFATGVIYEDIRGFDSIQVYWSEDDVALHIVLNASRDWTESRALSQAEDFLPSDVELDENGEELDEGELLFLGSSELLAEVTDRSTYRDYEVGGRAGDLRVILIPGDGSKFSTVDIAIGAGEEFAGGGSTRGDEEETPEPEPTKKSSRDRDKTPEPTEESRGSTNDDAEAYLTDARDLVDQRQEEVARVIEILSQDELTDADASELIELVLGWSDAPTLDAPKGYEELDKAITSMNNNFVNASESFALWASDTEANADSLDDFFTYLSDASDDVGTADELLTDEGY